MKEQTSETSGVTQDVVTKCSNEEHQQERHQHPKKVEECQDETNNNDAGYVTSSNDSLNAVTPTSEDDDNKWKLNIPVKPKNFSDDDILRIVKEITTEVKENSDKEFYEYMIDRLVKNYETILPRSLIELLASHFVAGDSGNSIDVKPDWLDIDKFHRGQKLAMDNLFGVFYADMLSLFIMFSFEDGLRKLIFTDASNTPYTAFKRYLSTGLRIKSWYSSDPWEAGTSAYNDIRAVRRMHALVRKKLSELSFDEYKEKTTIKDAWCPAWNITRRDFESTCPAPKPAQCAYTALYKEPTTLTNKLNQGEMAATQFAFVGLLILHPKFFGIHNATDDDLEAFCHVWRGIGYLLGIDDNVNWCRGTLDDVRARSRDFLEYWVKPNFRVVNPEWEHMMRCMVEGVQYYFPGSNYEICLLDLAEIMNLHMPRIYNSLSYSSWITRNMIRFIFNHASKLSYMKIIFNRQLNACVQKALNYDERKHQELRERSAKTIDSYLIQSKRTFIS